ncbi:SpoIIE family protein phosphatase [Microtetraspora sp. AC03309]|uniref:SpoIIE family protein phosphatase n=1 Tax=Microtetraspora sp. AC03309 TaxID=2779376 RepID=UPI001E29DA50|nr:SpoIIE family protein phosphatase [Microtetraspora sp. AC03309]MCC5580962.1 SpoIIE family protein phosphatase [Microtetraspora sp. AC03309]
MRVPVGCPTESEQYARALDEMLLRVTADVGAHIGAIYLLADADRVLLMDRVIGLPLQIAKPWARIRVQSLVPVAAAAARERRLVWVSDHHDLARRFPGAALAFPYQIAVATAPIHSGTRDFGVLMLVWPTLHPPQLSEGEREIIDAARRQIADLLRRAAEHGAPVLPGDRPCLLAPARSDEVTGQHTRAAVDCLNRLPESCVSLDLEGRITYATTTAAELLGGTVASLLGRPPWEVAAWLRNPVFEDRYRAAIVSREVTSYTAELPDGDSRFLQLFPDRSGITLRITSVPAAEPAAEEHGRESASGPARVPAARPPTLERVREPVSGLDRPPRAEAFYNLLHLTASLTRAVTMRHVVDLVADHVMPVFDVRAMAIAVLECGRMQVIGSRGYGAGVVDRFQGLPITLSTPGEHAVRTGEAEFFAIWDEFQQAYPHAVHYDEMNAWAFLPLIASDRPVGMCVLAYAEPHAFIAEERSTLTALAGLTAQALDRARIYDIKDRLAQSLQAGLLPSNLPAVPGVDVAARYLPATHGVGIGGDFYDLIRLDDSAVAAVIGDVQGHNMTAAALMGQVRTAVHAHAATGAGPGQVLTHTNRLLLDLSPDLFTSCLYVHLDLKRGALYAASAGHLPPLLSLPDEPGRIIDVPPGVLLGIDPGATYPTLEHPLPPGALLALYTDGLVESPGGDLGRAIANLAADLTHGPDRPLQQIADTLLQRAPHSRQRSDDIALLLLKTEI